MKKYNRVIRDKNIHNELDYNMLINYETLYHYENLLFSKIDEFVAQYNKKYDNSKLTGIISILVSIIAISNDAIGIKILMSIQGWTKIVSMGVFMAIPTYELFVLRKIKKTIKSLDVEFMKSEFSQEKLFFRFIINQLRLQAKRGLCKNKLDYDFETNYYDIAQYYYSGNYTSVIFRKFDLERYIYDHLKKNNNIFDEDISRFLSEVIIAKQLIYKKILKSNKMHEYKFVINKENIMKIQIYIIA